MVMAAIRNCPRAIKYAGINCKSKIEISLTVVTQDGMCLEYLSDEMKSNDTIVFAAIKECPFAIKYAHDKFKSNKTIALQLVSRNGLCIEYFSNIIKLNNNIIVTALTSNGNAIEFIDVKFHTKKNILIAAEKHINIIEYLKPYVENLTNDVDFSKLALSTFQIPSKINGISRSMNTLEQQKLILSRKLDDLDSKTYKLFYLLLLYVMLVKLI